MATIKLVPKTLPENAADAGDTVLSALNKAIELTNDDIAAGEAPRGCVIVFWREYPDGTGEENWITAGLNHIELLGVLHKTIFDIQLPPDREEQPDEIDGDA